ncbi:transglutaminase, N-terminal domain protein [Magnetococcus marinus MC-1]|uniref:Transglutaminase, N-terminal domain protein n=1 Tax=Magnetococcus marinus (strain ATCC BAA-1437 / JCM 17883 / MC-1) TaxID=156889 RepID=A0L4M6_MAGMM|nr:transglutaminase family protein [Magnetococcus marinus]ABK42919.1 transglutaminase, N-terminal domain protein [Magnetococcus marinus MC-1]
MTIQVAIHHHTQYCYDRMVNLSPHVFRLRPAPHCRTPIRAYSLKISPGNHFINWQQDPFGNYLARLVFQEKTDQLTVDVEVVADMVTINPFEFFLEDSAKAFPFAYEQALREDLTPYLKMTEESPALKKWLKDFKGSKGTVDFLVELNAKLNKDIGYTIRMEPGVQTCEETFSRGTGSCRDTGWLLVQAMRQLGLAARFVSGYLVQLTPDVKSLDGPSGPTEDFTDLHAWCEVYIPGAGWVGLDPTSGLFAGEGHIPLACTPIPASAAAVTGATDKCETTFHYKNTVVRIHEDPRVTKPYSSSQWSDILTLGEDVDKLLKKEDVRLTMGGEPTFVSVDDFESPQWTEAADGPHKRERAVDLLGRMRNHFAPGGIYHFGQGKWYPGEPIPRWRYGCYWRTDGEPIWRDINLLGFPTVDYGYGADEAEAFMGELARRLGHLGKFVSPAYEDPFYYVWAEAKLPVNLDPFKFNLKDGIERQKMAQVLQHGLQNPVGYVLPMAWNAYDQRWDSCKWSFRREHLFLIPGNSAIGLRLPLESLFYQSPAERPLTPEQDLFDTLGRLPKYKQLAKQAETKTAKKGKEPAIPPHPQVETFMQTALCVEVREGRLYLFIPPLTHVEGFLALVSVIEATAQALGICILLEGYSPPEDPRLKKFYVTPDPGVIEVNVHPSAHWHEMVENTEALYEMAHQARLGTEKFMLNGRQNGTGGGNHVTLGGITPADSPMLRRPDLLASLITYWQHHPGLSYLFSGLFIGPTSQAPRVDEGRDDALYELELALSQFPSGQVVQPWIVDRLLRNILVDVTGNTHRTEFCIDKLYSPDGPTGRLGLLELRAFEMPPHAQMSLVQMLLLRTIIARMWKAPYRHPLIRWGTDLHDRYLLGHYVRRDMEEVVDDLNREGYPFQLAWLEPFFEFRFPKWGEIQVGDIHLELRAGLEPWHVLGEEAGQSGTTRFVDSSLERMQVKVNGLHRDQYTVMCNGFELPLHSTGINGEYVAGVRFKAWQPWAALHPLMPTHAPLVVDVVDLRNGRSLGGCTYHVGHPGGRNYDTFPVNAYEAESRRISQFWNHGHTIGPFVPSPSPAGPGKFIPQGSGKVAPTPPLPLRSNEFPHTLDLRRWG